MEPYQTAFISGASSGFGLAIAKRFAAKKFRLILLARRGDRLQNLAQELSKDVACYCIACDISDQKKLRGEFEKIPTDFEDIDILVNNAGLALGLEPAHKTDWQDWQTMIDTNCTGLALLTRLTLPGMVSRNRGHIVMIGSTAGTYPYPGGNVYGATKAFVKQFSLNLRADLLGTAVRVTDIEPGMADGSEFSLVRFKSDAEKAAKVYQGVKALHPDDVAECVTWVISQPSHVNINRMEIMPVCQATGPLAVFRT